MTLPPDSLGQAMRDASILVAAVLEGHALTDQFAQMLRERPAWTDSQRGAVRDLAWGALRDYGRGEELLRALLHKPAPAPVHALLLVALHRLESRPDHAYAIVDQAVQAVTSFAPGLAGLTNAVLRNRQREAPRLDARLAADPVACHRHPQWWIERLQRSFPQDWEAVLAAGNSRPPMGLRVNSRRTTLTEVEALLAAQDLACRRLDHDALVLETPVPVARLPGFAEGRVSVQDAGAQWAAGWLDLADGQRVLDACAAPGGKSAHILECADVDLLSLELDRGRIARIHENLSRLGLAAQVVQGDARAPADWWDGRPFDRILADVPCSASGVVRRHPDIKWLRRPADIAGFVRQQAGIVDALWHTLAPGGKMLYVTCSVFDEENQDQISRFCRGHEDAELIPIDGQSYRQFLPGDDHDGFFYALLRKRV